MLNLPNYSDYAKYIFPRDYNNKCWFDYYPVVEEQKQGNANMEKTYAVMTPVGFKFKTYEEAEKEAKRQSASNWATYVVAQATAMVEQPVPEAVVTKL